MAELVFLLAGGAVFFLSFVAFDALRKAFEQYQRRYLARSIRDLSAMFLFIDPGQMLRLNFWALVLLLGAGSGSAVCSARRWPRWPASSLPTCWCDSTGGGGSAASRSS